MSLVNQQTAEMLEESGDFQRAYSVVRVYEEAYDAFAKKHVERYGSDAWALHLDAHKHALIILATVFQSGR